MYNSEVYLNPSEEALISDKEVIELKTSATKKVQLILNNCRADLKKHIRGDSYRFPDGIDHSSGKISKGENYRGLPFMVLDFPRLFTRKSIFAYRTMFWWGNEFSTSLHLQGEALSRYRDSYLQHLSTFSDKEIFFCNCETPWEYHFERSNYLPIDELPNQLLRKKFTNRNFIKLARKLPLDKYEKLPEFCVESFKLFTSPLL